MTGNARKKTLSGLTRIIYPVTGILVFMSALSFAAISIDTTPHLPPAEVHPSLYFSSEDIPVFRARIETAPYADWWVSLSSKAASYLGQDLSLSSLTEENRSKGAKTCAFAYMITGEESYASKAKEALLAMWASSNSNSRRMLDASYHLQSFCEAYDWIEPALSPSENAAIRQKLASEAERFYNHSVVKGSFLIDPYLNNWGVKASAALGTAALTISGYPSASHSPSQWLGRALGRINSILAQVTTNDGLWIEGPHYLVYTCGNLIPFLWHYRNVSQANLFDNLQPLFKFVLSAGGPDGHLPNIEDSYSSIFPHDMVAPAFLDGDGSGHMWAYQSCPFFDTVWWTQDVKEADLIIVHDEAIPALPPDDGPSVFFPASRVAILRSDWTSNGFYLYLNGAPDYTNTLSGGVHTHPDPLEIILHDKGSLLVHDAGYGPEGYDDDNRSWYTSAEAHNVIRVNGTVPQNATIRMATQVASDHLPLARLYTSYGGATVSRSVLLVGEHYAVIADHIWAGESASCELILHGRGTMALQDHSAVWSSTSPEAGAMELRASLFPGTTTLQGKTGLACFAWGEEEAASYVVSQGQGNNVTFLTVLAPVLAGEEPPAVSEISGDGCTGAVIDNDVVLVQGDSTLVSAGGLRTDGLLGFFRKDGSSALWLMDHGHALAWENILIVESSSRISLSGDMLSQNQYRLHISPNGNNYDLFLSLPDSLWAREVFHEGVGISCLQQNDGITVSLQGGGNILVDMSPADKGDVIRDGVFNIFDMIRTVHFIIGGGPAASGHETWAADMNYDGMIDILDLFDIATLILTTP